MSKLPLNLRPDLEARILRFEVDSGKPEFGFLDRLARENGWTLSHARDVFDEYLKFIYLCCITADTLTPSDAVDQAWHLHLTYSESYWTDLCGTVLGRAVHHGPTRGGRQEDQRYHDAYDRTLRLYQEVWGEPPAESIWPIAADRFRDAAAFRRVNTATHFIISRHKIAIALLPALAVIGYPAYAQARDDSVSVVTVFLTITVVALGSALIGFLLQRRHSSKKKSRQRRRGSSGGLAAGCSGTSGKQTSDGDGGGGSGCGGGGGCGSG